ncbi:E3 ubiquitin-protein ligase TRIM35-like [Festucalex cinctus]
MATQAEKDFFCPSCWEVSSDAAVLPCQHGFCLVCVQKLRKKKGKRSCPVCRLSWSSMDPPLVFSSPESDDICSLHKEKLKFFCLDHQEVVCMSCRDEKIHAGHKLRPLDEVVKGPTEELMHNVKGKLADYSHVRNDCNEQAAHVKLQKEQIESKIEKHVEELRRFLLGEEEASLAAVREEEEEKSRMMEEKIEALSKAMAALSAVITSTEELLTSDPVSFIRNFQSVMTRIEKLPDEPKWTQKRALLDKAKYVGKRKFSMWERIKARSPPVPSLWTRTRPLHNLVPLNGPENELFWTKPSTWASASSACGNESRQPGLGSGTSRAELLGR